MINSNDQDRFETIYEKESDSLFRFCLLRVSDREQALDLTQEAFTRLWTYLAQGKSVENPRALVYKVAHNLIIDWYRKTKSVSLEGLLKEDGDKEFDPPDEKADLAIELDADAKRVLVVLNNLEPQYREVMHLRYVDDLSPKEIAEILGLNANTVSVRLTRGMEALRELMGIQGNKQ